jgi:mRNA interferase MazF
MTTAPQHSQHLITRRGDVVLALFPNADLRSAKPRLAVVLQVNDLDAGLPQVVVAMITSQLSRAGHPSRVMIPLDSEAGKHSGLQSDSVVMTDNLATIQLAIVARVVGVLPMDAIDRALKHTLGLAAN